MQQQPDAATGLMQAVPILIGITGKRRFATDATENERLAGAVRQRLDALFREIDRRCPHAPKVLLTGGAYGTDLLAAEAALAAGPHWSVAVVLPFAQALFEKDFRTCPPDGGDGAHPQLAALHGLIAQATGGPAARVLVRTMPPLRTTAGTPATDAELDKDRPGQDAALRRAHYEQVGHFIAETAVLLIAVMSVAEPPDSAEANGGTARIAEYRRVGRPDRVGEEAARRSDVVRSQWSDLVAPPGGPVWVLDPAGPAAEPHLPTVIVGPQAGGHAGPVSVDDSLLLARGFDDFEALRRRQSGVAGRMATPADLSPVEDLADHLAAIRRVIDPPQRHAKREAERSLGLVAGLFLVAVLLLEVFAKLAPGQYWLLLLYILALCGIGGVVLRARWYMWQPRAEDYRAVSEMLRVQRAWWAAGVAARVDRLHLQGVSPDLARPRDAARAVLGWAMLRANWRAATDWTVVARGGAEPRATRALIELPSADRPRDWVGEQIWYYARAFANREARLARRDTATWFLFTTSALLAFALWLWLAFPAAKQVMDATVQALAPLGSTLAAALMWLGLAVAAGMLRLRWHHCDGWRALALTGLAGLAAAGFGALALRGLGPPLAAALDALGAPLPGSGSAETSAKYLAIVVFVALSAWAGAIRFLTEKLGLEAEALDYRDALDKFEQAERLLAGLLDPTTAAPRDAAAAGRARAAVEELGRLALRENEAWLKAHRERPLSPVVG